MKKLLILFVSITTLMGSCKKFLDVNTDPNNPVDVQPGLILAPVELNISDNVYAGNAATIVQNFLQAIAPNQVNPGLWNYQLFNNTTDGDWNVIYTTCLQNLRLLNEKAEAGNSFNYAGIAKILTAYTLAMSTDLWGDVPYSEGFKGSGNFTPAYDKQEAIYKNIQSLLSTGIGNINQGSTIKPQGDDYFYGGDMDKWKKLAYTLKARYFMHLSKAPGYTAAVQADSVLAALANGMTANADEFKFEYQGEAGTENIWNLAFSPVSTYVLNSTFIETLKTRSDPRLSKMAKPAAGTGLYTGRTIGTPTGSLDSYSYPGDYYAGADASHHLVNYAEALFLKAEATFIKSGFAAASPFYIAGIQSHMTVLGIDPLSVPATTYIASRAITAGNAVQRIIEEKNTANFLNFENYNDWRRTGFPSLTPVSGALSAIPRRMLYPQSELLTNPRPEQTAAATDKVWWDQ